MFLFSETDYRKILKRLCEERKTLDAKFSFQKMAAGARIPKSYLSRVLGGGADLNQDQMFEVCRVLGLDAQESEYMDLLIQRARAVLNPRKAELDRRIRDFQTSRLSAKEHLKAKNLDEDIYRDYYLDPFHQLVHMALSIREFAQDPIRLAQELGLTTEAMQSLLQSLERMGIISREKGEIKTLLKSVHLPKESKVYPAWRDQMRILAMNRAHRIDRNRDYCFSVAFSADEATRVKLQSKFLDFIKEAQGAVSNATPKAVYQINFDLIPWTEDKT